MGTGTKLEKVKPGDRIRAEPYNELVDGVNQIKGAFGRVGNLPGALLFPPEVRNTPFPGASTVVRAIVDDSSASFSVGEIVAVKDFRASANRAYYQKSDLTTAVVVDTPAANDGHERPYGVVVKTVDATGTGFVIVDGFAWAKVVRPAGWDQGNAASLLNRHAVLRLQVQEGETGSETIGAVSFGMGVADVIWEQTINDGDDSAIDPTDQHWALVRLNPRSPGCNYIQAAEDKDLTGDPAQDVIKIQFLDRTGEPHGEKVTVPFVACCGPVCTPTPTPTPTGV